MLSHNTISIIRFLSTNHGKIYNINQTARALKISVGSAYEILKELEKQNVVKNQRLGNAIFYCLNKQSQEARLLLRLIKLNGDSCV